MAGESSRTTGHGASVPTSRAGRLRRGLLLAAGFLSLALGALGVVLPVLPTTPFIILAAFCFARSSQRCYRWLVSNRVFGRPLCAYLEGRGVAWKTRVPVLVILWTAITLTALLALEHWALRTVLFLVAATVTAHLALLRRPGGDGCREARPRGGGLRDIRWLGVAVSMATYAVAIAAAIAVVWYLPLDHPLALIGVGTVVATLVVFAGSVVFDNSSLYDPYWSLQPFAIALVYLWWVGSAAGVRGIVVVVLTGVYAVRLTGNFYRGWAGLRQEDFRYRDFRQRSGRAYWLVSLFGIHLFPTAMVWLGCLPLFGLMRAGTSPFGWLDVVAAVVFLGAVALSSVADEQLRGFRRDPANQGHYIQTGLWSISRHPNYLGEILCWWGLWLFALAAGVGWWWTVVGALAITLMFVFVSIPMMEGRNRLRRPGYEAYLRETPMLLPRPRRTLGERHAD